MGNIYYKNPAATPHATPPTSPTTIHQDTDSTNSTTTSNVNHQSRMLLNECPMHSEIYVHTYTKLHIIAPPRAFISPRACAMGSRRVLNLSL